MSIHANQAEQHASKYCGVATVDLFLNPNNDQIKEMVFCYVSEKEIILDYYVC